MRPSARSSMCEFVEALAKGEGNFYDGWMKNPIEHTCDIKEGQQWISVDGKLQRRL